MTLTHSITGEKIAVQFDIPGTIKFRDYNSNDYDNYDTDKLYVILYADWEYDVEHGEFSIFITDVVNYQYSYLNDTTLNFQKCPDS